MAPAATPISANAVQIAPPIDETLFHDQAADQDRRAIGVVGDFRRSEVRSSAFH